MAGLSVTAGVYCGRMDLVIDCDTCAKQDSDACADCVVSFLVSREPDDAVVFDVASYAAVRRLQRAGLVADLHHQPKQEPGALGATG